LGEDSSGQEIEEHAVDMGKKYGGISPGVQEAICAEGAQGQSLRSIGQRYGVSHESVRQILKKSGIVLAPRGDARKEIAMGHSKYKQHQNPVYYETPNTDEIEAETDVRAAEMRAARLTVEYLRVDQQMANLRCQMANLDEENYRLRYLFIAARRKFFELQIAASDKSQSSDGETTKADGNKEEVVNMDHSRKTAAV
jgi:hypothetical protein